MSWLRRGRRSRIALALHANFEDSGSSGAKRRTYVCPCIPVQSGLGVGGVRGYHGCVVWEVGEGNELVLAVLVVGHVSAQVWEGFLCILEAVGYPGRPGREQVRS